jgi:hypothetical protein
LSLTVFFVCNKDVILIGVFFEVVTVRRDNGIAWLVWELFNEFLLTGGDSVQHQEGNEENEATDTESNHFTFVFFGLGKISIFPNNIGWLRADVA